MGALFENFFLAIVQKKFAFFKLNDGHKFFPILQSKKKAFTQAEHEKLNTVANMVAKLDTDAPKFF